LIGKKVDTEELIELAFWSMKVKSEFVLPDWEDRENIHKALSSAFI